MTGNPSPSTNHAALLAAMKERTFSVPDRGTRTLNGAITWTDLFNITGCPIKAFVALKRLERGRNLRFVYDDTVVAFEFCERSK